MPTPAPSTAVPTPLALNRTRAARFIGISPDTLDRAERDGLIRSVKTGDARNATRLYPVVECYRFLGLDVDGTPIGEDGS